jgi:hypothetical protein
MVDRFYYGQTPLRVVLSEYQAGGLAVLLKDDRTAQPYATLSVKLAQADPEPGCFWLKDWSENEPIAKHMLDRGLLELTGRTCITGFVVAKEARLK